MERRRRWYVNTLNQKLYHVAAVFDQSGRTKCGFYVSKYIGDRFANSKQKARGRMCKNCARSI